jgi:predicted GH43/DUF377 family glycosyl hydrolase
MNRAEKIAAALANKKRIASAPSQRSKGTEMVRRELPCRFLGGADGGTVRCPSCTGTVDLKTFDCSKHSRCTPTKKAPHVACCVSCGDYAPKLPAGPAWDMLAPLKFDKSNLYPELPGHRFNSSIIRRGDGYVFCWRDGWAGSDLWCCRMDTEFRPVGDPAKLEINHWASGYGREDPQLFDYGGQLYVSFVGVQGAANRVVRTNMMFAALSEKFAVLHVYAPRAPKVDASRWEKNWGFFEHEGGLYAIYSIDPHKVLRIRGGSCEWVYEGANPLKWEGGERRGGTPPVRVDGDLWTFFHDRVDRKGAKSLYRMGLIVNEGEFPFRPIKHIPVPIAVAEPLLNPGNYVDCLFPRGAVRTGDKWVITSGVHDRWTQLQAFDHEDLKSRLVGI